MAGKKLFRGFLEYLSENYENKHILKLKTK